MDKKVLCYVLIHALVGSGESGGHVDNANGEETGLSQPDERREASGTSKCPDYHSGVISRPSTLLLVRDQDDEPAVEGDSGTGVDLLRHGLSIIRGKSVSFYTCLQRFGQTLHLGQLEEQ